MTANLTRVAVGAACAEVGALIVALKNDCPGGAFLAANELLVQICHGGAYSICRALLDQILEASGDATHRAGWRCAVFRIECALKLDHHPVAAAAQTAKNKGPDHWASYIRDIRQATVTGD